MLLTQKTKYALNIIGFLYREPKRITTAKEIANLYALSPSFVEAALRDLRAAKIVSAIKGPGGGYHLSSEYKSLKVGDIVSATVNKSEQTELFADSMCEGVVNSFHAHVDSFYETPIKEFLR